MKIYQAPVSEAGRLRILVSHWDNYEYMIIFRELSLNY